MQNVYRYIRSLISISEYISIRMSFLKRFCKRPQGFDPSSTYVHPASIQCLLGISPSSWPYEYKN